MDIICFVRREVDVTPRKAIEKIHKILNHKKKEQMEYSYRTTRKLDTETKNIIKEVVDQCEICKQNGRSKSRP